MANVQREHVLNVVSYRQRDKWNFMKFSVRFAVERIEWVDEWKSEAIPNGAHLQKISTPCKRNTYQWQ